MNRLIENFTESEFRCRCGGCELGYHDMDMAFLERLEAARENAGVPFVVSSAVRCPEWNRKVGGVSTSAHLTGHAVDIAAENSRRRWQIVRGAYEAGFNRIGIAASFIHLDNDPEKAPGVIWLY